MLFKEPQIITIYLHMLGRNQNHLLMNYERHIENKFNENRTVQKRIVDINYPHTIQDISIENLYYSVKIATDKLS